MGWVGYRAGSICFWSMPSPSVDGRSCRISHLPAACICQCWDLQVSMHIAPSWLGVSTFGWLVRSGSHSSFSCQSSRFPVACVDTAMKRATKQVERCEIAFTTAWRMALLGCSGCLHG